MKKHLFIGKFRENYGAGCHYNYVKLQSLYPDRFDYFNSKDVRVLPVDELLEKYDKLILVNQSHHRYDFKLSNKLLLSSKRIFLFTRLFNDARLYNSITNGFSIYKAYNGYKSFIPTICTSYNKLDIEPQEVCFGFYYRSNNPDAFSYFCKMMTEYGRPVNIAFCGREPNINLIRHFIPNACNITHTTDMSKFFSTITHYVMPKSAIFVDPLPHVIIEAIQHNKQIICPTVPNRNHKDGIDDVLSLIQYHTTINNKFYDNSETALDVKKFNNFYNKVFIDMIYTFNKEKYNTFYDWCSHEL
jgi:hypothetical protein